MNDTLKLINGLVPWLARQTALLFVHTKLYAKLFLVKTQQLCKKHALGSSLKHSLTYQNKVRTLNRYVFQLIFQYLCAKNPREGLRALLVHHLAELPNAERHVLQDAEGQSLVRSFLFYALNKHFEGMVVVKN